MADRELARDIEDAAVDWAAKAARELTEPERKELDRWLEGDPRRLGAFVRAQAAWIHAERAAALGSEADAAGPLGEAPAAVSRASTAPISRRALIAGGGALAASAAGAAFFTSARYRTIESGIGEVRRLTLADGSKLTLDTDSRVRISEASGSRALELVYGKLFLAVAEARQPLSLLSSGLAMRMAEGAFAVEALPKMPIVALVTKGWLSISQRKAPWITKAALPLKDNTTFKLPLGAPLAEAEVRPLNSAESDQLLAWRDGMLSFSGEALGAAVREFDRYSTMRIIITDPALAQQRITGLFRADDPRGFAGAVAVSFGAGVRADGGILKIFTK